MLWKELYFSNLLSILLNIMQRVFNSSLRRDPQNLSFRSKKINLSGSYSSILNLGKENIIRNPKNAENYHSGFEEELKTYKIQNHQLKQLIKVLKTQLQFHKEQQQRNHKKEENYQDYKLLIRKINSLKEKNHNLLRQVQSIKKNVRYTQNQELASQLQQAYKQIKRLKVILKSQEACHQPIYKLNEIIEKQYQQQLKIQQLQRIMEQKQEQIKNQQRLICKFKISTGQKIKQVNILEKELIEARKKSHKKDNSEQHSFKYEFDCQKRSIMVMQDTIVGLQKKIGEYEIRIQTMKDNQIEIINKQTQKRKQLLQSLQQIRLEKEKLEETLLNIKKRTQKPRVASKMFKQKNEIPFQDKQPNKKRNPLNVKPQHIKNIKNMLVNNLQNQRKSSTQAIQLLSQNDKKINIRTLAHRLQFVPMNLSEQQAELLSRFVLEQPLAQNSSGASYIDYDKEQNIEIMKSVFKKLFDNYPIFSQQDIQCFKKKCLQFERTNLFNLRASLWNKKQKNYRGASEFQAQDIFIEIKTIVDDKELIDYIYFKAFSIIFQKISLQAFFSEITQ